MLERGNATGNLLVWPLEVAPPSGTLVGSTWGERGAPVKIVKAGLWPEPLNTLRCHTCGPSMTNARISPLKVHWARLGPPGTQMGRRGTWSWETSVASRGLSPTGKATNSVDLRLFGPSPGNPSWACEHCSWTLTCGR